MLVNTRPVKPENKKMMDGYRYLLIELGHRGLVVETIHYRNDYRIVRRYQITPASRARVNSLIDGITPNPNYKVSSYFGQHYASTKITPKN